MALIVKSAGWHTDPETGQAEYRVQLVAETEADVPDIGADVIWRRKPVILKLADEEGTP